MSDETVSPELTEAAPMTAESAASLLTRLSEPAPRADDGKFVAKERTDVISDPAAETPAKAETPKDDAKVVDLKTGKPPEPAKAEDDDDLEFEIPGEKDGEQPKRFKLSELYDGYEKAAKLEKELEEVRAKPRVVPAEVQTQLQETIRTRSEYLRGLEQVARIIQPQPPSLELADENSPKYDPVTYAEQMRRYNGQLSDLKRLSAEHEKLSKQQEAEQKILSDAHSARQAEMLQQKWPEFLKDKTVAEGVAKALHGDYGFTREEIESIGDARQLLVIRDALELRALKAKQADAVKVVRAKPKLVKGAARTTTDTKTAARSNAMARLQATGSVDAAAEALKGLI